jgi:integrase family protein with SAM-like domain
VIQRVITYRRSCRRPLLSGHRRSLPPVITPADGIADGIAISPAGAVPMQESAAAPAAVALLAHLDTDHPTLAALPARERLLAAAWLAGYRSPRTRLAYALDVATWLDWLHGLEVDVLAARRVHVDLWVRHLLDIGAASSSTARRLSALTSFYDHLITHDVLTANPAAAVRRPRVDPDHPRPSGSTAPGPARSSPPPTPTPDPPGCAPPPPPGCCCTSACASTSSPPPPTPPTSATTAATGYSP